MDQKSLYTDIKNEILSYEKDIGKFSRHRLLPPGIQSLVETDVLAVYISRLVKEKGESKSDSEVIKGVTRRKESQFFDIIKNHEKSSFNIELTYYDSEFCEGEYKLRANAEIRMGEAILTVPSKLIMNVSTMLHYSTNRLLLSRLYLIARRKLVVNEESDVFTFIMNILCIFLMIESQDPDTIYREYFDFLPNTKSFPLYWSAEEIGQLQGYTKTYFLLRKERTTNDYYENILPVFESYASSTVFKCTIESYFNAIMIMFSKAFVSEHTNGIFIVPVADMIKLKHKSISETLGETGFNFNFAIGFTMLSDRRYKDGEEVFYHHPSKSSLDTLFDIGHVNYVKDRKKRISYLADAQTLLVIPVDQLEPDGNLFEAKKGLFLAFQINPNEIFVTNETEDVMSKLMRAMRIYSLTVSDFVSSKKGLIIECLIQNKRISLPNEICSIKSVLASIDHSLKLFATTFDNDKELFLSENYEERSPMFTALLFRLSEKKLLLDLKGKFELLLQESIKERKLLIAERLSYEDKKTNSRTGVFEMFKKKQMKKFLSNNNNNNNNNNNENEDQEIFPEDNYGEEDGNIDDRMLGVVNDVSPPEDNDLKLVIDETAKMVANNGSFFEETLKLKQESNVIFNFLKNGDLHHDYYKWKIFKLKQERSEKLFNNEDISDNDYEDDIDNEEDDSLSFRIEKNIHLSGDDDSEEGSELESGEEEVDKSLNIEKVEEEKKEMIEEENLKEEVEESENKEDQK